MAGIGTLRAMGRIGRSHLKRGMVLLGAVSLTAGLAMAAPPAAKAGKKPANSEAAVKPAAAGKDEARPATDKAPALLASLRRAVAESAKSSGDKPDLAADLLRGVADLAMVNALHGHFALAGVGHAMRTGGIPVKEALEFARNMKDNFHMIAEDFNSMATQKAFDPELRDVFRSLQILAVHAEESAASLVAWALAPTEPAKAHAFEAALEDYRSRVQGFYAALKR